MRATHTIIKKQAFLFQNIPLIQLNQSLDNFETLTSVKTFPFESSFIFRIISRGG